ncbi:MAG TPA: pyridoxal 5'-phosphate synthase lyase subunit PdxS [Methanothrix sp.]|nr:pyridoxal 5'-phosphate synthase lyase subunit PdxS [Methanothrix sp.]
MGMGDVKLAVILGMWVGWIEPVLVVYSLIVASFVGLIVGVGVLAVRRESRPYPFGPWLATGAVAVIVWSEQILEAIGVDMIDESEVLTPADEFHVDKSKFTVPFVCGARNLGEALRRIKEGAAMVRTKGEAGTGDVREAVRHMRLIGGSIRSLKGMADEELSKVARDIEADFELVLECRDMQRLPVVNFAAGGIATPADASLMMQMGADGVFVGSGIFKSQRPEIMASAIVEAVNNYDDPEKLLEASIGLGEPMKGIDAGTLGEGETLQTRGW